jgi:hypothetical protein
MPLCRYFLEVQEIDMFSRPLRLAHGSDANELRVARKGAAGAAEIFWLALIAALVAWVASPSTNPPHALTGSSPGCVFVGKGGVICNGSATAAQNIATESADPCLSLGKGGRYCPPTK